MFTDRYDFGSAFAFGLLSVMISALALGATSMTWANYKKFGFDATTFVGIITILLAIAGLILFRVLYLNTKRRSSLVQPPRVDHKTQRKVDQLKNLGNRIYKAVLIAAKDNPYYLWVERVRTPGMYRVSVSVRYPDPGYESQWFSQLHERRRLVSIDIDGVSKDIVTNFSSGAHDITDMDDENGIKKLIDALVADVRKWKPAK